MLELAAAREFACGCLHVVKQAGLPLSVCWPLLQETRLGLVAQVVCGEEGVCVSPQELEQVVGWKG